MLFLINLLLIFSISIGQLIKLPFGTLSSATLLDISILFLCLVGLIKFIVKKNTNFEFATLNPFFYSALTFILIALFSLLITPIKLTSSEYLFSLLYLVRFSLFILLAWLISKNVFPLLNSSLVLITSGIILAILGILQLIFIPDLSFLATEGWDPHYFRAVSTLLDPNFLGTFLGLTLVLIIQSPINFLSKKWKIIFFLITYLGLITTFSRSSGVILLASFLVLSFFKKSLPILLLTILLFAGFFLSYLGYRQFVAGPRNIDKTASAKFRINSWEQGYQEFIRSPIFGIGFNSYKYALSEYNLAPKEELQTRGSTSNDSSLLFVAATTGLVGLFAYLFFLLSIFKVALSNIKSYKAQSITLTAGFCGLLINSFFINSLFYPFILIWIILMTGELLKD